MASIGSEVTSTVRPIAARLVWITCAVWMQAAVLQVRMVRRAWTWLASFRAFARSGTPSG
jgi:hypothetical protein